MGCKAAPTIAALTLKPLGAALRPIATQGRSYRALRSVQIAEHLTPPPAPPQVNPQMHQLGMGADLQLALEQGQVVGHGLGTDAQLLGNPSHRGALGQHHENFQLTLGHALQARVAGILL